MKRSFNYQPNNHTSNKRLRAWESFFGIQFRPPPQNQHKIITPCRSAWYYLRHSTKVMVVETIHDSSLYNMKFNSVQEAADFFKCKYFYIHMAVKGDFYLRGQVKLKYIM